MLRGGHESEAWNRFPVLPTEHVPVGRRSLGIDLGGASSDTTGYVVLDGAERPHILAAGRPARSESPVEAEERLLGLVDDWRPSVVAIDAPLTLPPCLTCPSFCRGPGTLCELRSAQEMWTAGRNPVSQRACEVLVQERAGERPMPTMQLGVITGRAVAFARRLATRGIPPSVMERGEIVEVYPRASLRRLGGRDARLLPRAKSETPTDFRARVLEALGERIDGIPDHVAALDNGHVLDALVAAYTGWLAPDGVESPPPDFNLASGWIWLPLDPSSAPRASVAAGS